MTDIDIKVLRVKAEAAASGPWIVRTVTDDTEYGDFAVHGIGPNVAEPIHYSDSAPAHVALDPLGPFDADYIAAASPDVVLALLDRIEAAEKIIAEARETDAQTHRFMTDRDPTPADSSLVWRILSRYTTTRDTKENR